MATQKDIVILRNKAWNAWGKWHRYKDAEALARYFDYCERLVSITEHRTSRVET